MSTAPPLPVAPVVQKDPRQQADGETSSNLFTPSKLRAWGAKSALSLVDQAMTSLAGCSVSLLLARWMLPEVYGAFAVAFAGYLFVCGFYNVIVLEPVSVIGPARHFIRVTGYFQEQVAVHAVLTGGLSVLVLLAGTVVWLVEPQSPLVGAVLGGGLALPFLLFLWLARRMCYVVRRPSIALLGSGFYLAIVLIGLFVLRHFAQLRPFVAFLLTGSASLLAALFILKQLDVKMPGVTRDPRTAWSAALRENWTYGRWLAGSAMLYGLSSQVQTFLLAGMVGLGATGILRAMQLPSLLMAQVVTAASVLVLPALSYDFGCGRTHQMKAKATIAGLGLASAAVSFAGLLALVAGSAERLLYGGKYAAYVWLMPVLALMPVTNALFLRFSMTLRAAQKPHFDLLSNVVATPIAVLSAFAFVRWWGIAGAAASMVLSSAALGIATMVWSVRGDQYNVVEAKELSPDRAPVS